MQLWACFVGKVAPDGETATRYATERLSRLSLDEQRISCHSVGNVHLLLARTTHHFDNALTGGERDRAVAWFSSRHAVRSILDRPNDPFDPVGAFEILCRDPRRAVDLCAPASTFGMNREGIFHAFNDLVGFEKIYYARSDAGCEVIANSSVVAALLTQSTLRPSARGWASYIQYGIFLGSTTPFSGVEKLGPATHVTGCPRQAKFSFEFYHSLSELFEPKVIPDRPEQLGAALDEFMGFVGNDIVDGVCIGFSGGRDSRCIAAAAIKAQLPIRLETYDSPEADAILAECLVEKLGGLDWNLMRRRSLYRAEDVQTLSIENIIARQARFFEYFCGDVTPLLFSEPGVDLKDRPAGFDLSMQGLFGENARAFLYGADHLQGDIEFSDNYFGFLKSPNAVLAHDANASNKALIREFENAARSKGIAGLTRLDMYYLLARNRCRPDISQGNKALRPFGSSKFLRAALSQTPRERVGTEYFRDIVRMRVPEWSDVPYTFELNQFAAPAGPSEHEMILASRFFRELQERLYAGEFAPSFLNTDFVRTRIDALHRSKPKHLAKLTKQFLRVLTAESFAAYVRNLCPVPTTRH